MHISITARLEQHYRRCNSPRRRTRIMTRWADIDALAGLAPDEIVDICSRPTTDQNPVVAALIALHQHGDVDATTVLMTVLRPMVLAAAKTRRKGHINSHVIDNDWAATAHTIGTTDPTIEPVDADGHPVVFLTYLGNQIGYSRRRFDPAAQRWLARRQRGTKPTLALLQHDSSSDGADTEGSSTSDTAVEDAALARIELDRIATVVTTGQLPRSRWDQLVAHRIDHQPDTIASTTTRVAVHRTANQLARLVDHAA